MNFLVTTSTLPETNGSWHLKMVEHGVCLFSGAILLVSGSVTSIAGKHPLLNIGIFTFAPFMLDHSSQRDSFRFDSAGDQCIRYPSDETRHCTRHRKINGMHLTRTFAAFYQNHQSSVHATGFLLSKDP